MFNKSFLTTGLGPWSHFSRKSIFQPGRFRLGWVALLLLSTVAFTACGNDDPYPSASFSTDLRELQQQMGVASAGGLTAITSPSLGPTVETLIVGPIIITHRNTPYTGAGDVTQTAWDLIQDDAISSSRFLEVVSLPSNGNTISFRIPHDSSGNWQLAAVGLKYKMDRLSDIAGLYSDAPIWFGFIGTFLNGKVSPGDTLTLTMEPVCDVSLPNRPADLCP